MYSLENLLDYEKEILIPLYKQNMLRIEEYYNKNKFSIKKEFIKTCNELFEKCIKMQSENKKQDIAIMQISYLRSACLTETFELQINLFDDSYYLDRQDVFQLLKLNFIYDYFKNDIELFEKKAKNNVFKYSYKQLSELKQKYIIAYHFITLKILNDMICAIEESTYFKEVRLSNNFKILFGGYMEDSLTIYSKDSQKIKADSV